MMREHVLGVCVSVRALYQTKVSKLEVLRRDDEDGRATTERDSARDRRHQIVRVCSWTDRRNGDSRPRNSTEESSDDARVTPSVKELAKHFSSNCVSAVNATMFLVEQAVSFSRINRRAIRRERFATRTESVFPNIISREPLQKRKTDDNIYFVAFSFVELYWTHNILKLIVRDRVISSNHVSFGNVFRIMRHDYRARNFLRSF